MFANDLWSVLEALGTTAAVVAALGIALVEGRRYTADRRRQASHDREREEATLLAQARLVSGWTVREVKPSFDGTHYIEEVKLHLANASDSPVFDVKLSVGIGEPVVQIGPLAAPVQITTLPRGDHRSWDISTAMLAHTYEYGSQPREPVVRVEFVDAEKTAWRRGFDGSVEIDPAPLPSCQESDGDLSALGNLDSPLNPMTVAVGFWRVVVDEEVPSAEILRPVLAPTEGWKSFNDNGVTELREIFEGTSTAAHVHYGAPRVAYVRFPRVLALGDDAEQVDGVLSVPAVFMTLAFYLSHGWRVFAVGGRGIRPDEIHFPDGDLIQGGHGPP